MQRLDKHSETTFYITGILFMIVVSTIKYLTNTEMSITALLASFIFGGVVGLLATTKKDSFLKNVVFIAAIAWLIWAMLNPITTIGNSLVIKQTELLAIIAFVVIMLERDILNSINRTRHKPIHFGIGIFGITAIFYFLNSTTFWKELMSGAGYLYYLIAMILGSLIYLYVRLKKVLGKASNSIIGVFQRKRK